MFERILVPLDGSKRAEQALPVAAKIARSSGGSVVLVRVSMPDTFTGPSVVGPLFTPEMFERERIEITYYLAHLPSLECLRGVTTVAHIAEGMPAQAILSAVDALQADLIVMCSHGRTGFTRWMLGSVAQHVARHSTVPVLIVREATESARVSGRDAYSVRVMVALDGSPLAEEALTPAAYLSTALSTQSEGALHLVLVVHLPVEYEYGQNDALARAKKQGIQQAWSYLNALEQRIQTGNLSSSKLQVTASVAVSMDVADTLIQIAEGNEQENSTGYDIIALTTHGRSGPKRWIMGSVAERLLGATRLPLLIIHPHKSKEPHEEGKEVSSVKDQTSEGTKGSSQVGLL